MSPYMGILAAEGYTPDMRETDDDVIRLSTLFVYTWKAALQEVGDIVAPIQCGLTQETDIVTDRHQLYRKRYQGYTNLQQITLLKTVGSTIEDLAAAIPVIKALWLITDGSLSLRRPPPVLPKPELHSSQRPLCIEMVTQAVA